MNLFDGPRGIAVKILNRIDRTDAYLDKVIESEMRNTDLKGADKALLYEIAHGCIRWLNKLDWILTGFYKGQFIKCIPNVKNAMRVALYQILFLDKVPPYAAVNEAVEFVKKLQGKKSADLTNAVLRNIIRNKENIRFPNREEDLIGYFSAYYSHPIWLIKRWLKQFGEAFTEELLIANNEKPSLTLRVNNLVSNKDEVKKLLQSVKQHYQDTKYNSEFIRLKSLSNISDWEYFKNGYVTIQDESTGFPCKLLDPKPGMKVLDICSAPGGKTAFLADLMQNKGEIVALDLFESRLNILEKNIERLGVKNVRTVAVDALEFEETGFDKILADVPCSGLGTLTKKPDIKWKRSLSGLNKLTKLQYSLLEKCASLVKVGGEIVYSTCTIDKVENFDIVEKFLKEHPDFKLVKADSIFDDILIDANGCVQTFPHIHGIDGAFAAKIIREK
ncbi:MAG: 16S rRNA (cytosine(967)-C(5))-methyltransferase RsmB [Melioribacteraceae bacterium]|nr:16S rRNA (cytosine(967)-C(5))-methyltransferase RsmB [Melioribacteraceae bacterium]